MSRLGPWEPSSLEERIDRLESLAAIRQLPYRYALGVDSRDMDLLVDLFVPDVRVGRDEVGRDALKRWFTDALSRHQSSCHFVGNHIVDFDDTDHARGIVYCHDELDHPIKNEWAQGQLQYWDTYRREGGEWCFERRRFHRLYMTDWLTRPSHGVDQAGGSGLTSHQLPEAFPSWSRFWEAVSYQEAER